MKIKNRLNQNEEVEEKTNELLLLPSLFGSDYIPRIVSLYGEVSELTCKNAIAGLYHLHDTGAVEEVVECEEEEEAVVKTTHLPIEFIISTEGGSVSDMFALYDCMRDIRKEAEINCLGIGKIMSAGVLLLAGGTKGKRRVGKNCRLMLHSISGGHFGSLKELEVDIKEVRWFQDQYAKALAAETSLSERQIKNIFRRKTDTYFDAETAVKWGIADEVV
jgi:ATP-dependent Clp endopeptidase proteolytic subunit ClpP